MAAPLCVEDRTREQAYVAAEGVRRSIDLLQQAAEADPANAVRDDAFSISGNGLADWSPGDGARAISLVGIVNTFAVHLHELHAALTDEVANAAGFATALHAPVLVSGVSAPSWIELTLAVGRRIYEAFLDDPHGEAAIVLGSGGMPNITFHVEQWPAVRERILKRSIDCELVYAGLFGEFRRQATAPAIVPPQPKLVDPRWEHGPDFRSATWNGDFHEFTGPQAAVVKILWEAYDKGTPAVGATYLIDVAGSAQNKLSLVFRDNSAFGTMIVEGKTKGSYRLSERIS